jgi:hypothetical protein
MGMVSPGGSRQDINARAPLPLICGVFLRSERTLLWAPQTSQTYRKVEGMQVTETRRHVLIWVAPEFLKSSGMIQLFTEAGISMPPEGELDEYIRSAEAAGGFAMTGRLVESGHGAGIWISPVNVPGFGTDGSLALHQKRRNR